MTYIYIYGTNEVERVIEKGVKMKKVLFSFFLVFLAFFISSAEAQENITITTFYPSPFGVYRDLETQTIRILNSGEEVLIGAGGNNPGIELRDLDAGGNTPYIDFSNDAASDFDFRLILTGDNDFNLWGGRTTFRNDDGTPAVARVREIWFCTSY